MQSIKKILLTCIFLTLISVTTSSWASIVIAGTRVIFPSNETEVDIKLNNVGNNPALVQAWLDKGDPRAVPDQIKVPFVLTPPLFRLDPQKGQTLRLVYTKEPLPTDRESVFWLNVLEVPPKAKTSSANTLQLAFRTRIKVFFRPQQFNSQSQIQAAPAEITWHLQNTPNGYVLLAKNPTPYFISIPTVMLINGNKKIESSDSEMLAPFGQQQFKFKGLTTKPTGSIKVSFTNINDWGSSVTTQSLVAN